VPVKTGRGINGGLIYEIIISSGAA
jgi:hypothetical protein